MLDLLPEDDFRVLADPIRFKQILVNLVGNAVKFTERGMVGLRLRAHSTDDPQIKRIRVSVMDTGIGITDEQKTRLFKAFEQADTSTRRRYGGTGLGLMISNRLVEAMGGSIQLDSQPKVGSTFSFEVRLPLMLSAI
ncbi:ATP-binding protein, partial [Arthrospira platensis SPKY1]|nr:ATP-binding protein [Arthrospira platensis SPKY1]